MPKTTARNAPATRQAAGKTAGGKVSAKKAAAKTIASKGTAAKPAPKTPSARRTSTTQATAKKTTRAAAKKTTATASKPVLLSGGNPQIPKGHGDAPVQAYIAAMPGWKHDLGRRLDALIEQAVPGVKKAVKWNSPLYGVDGSTWFLSLHCFAQYVKVAFFRGQALKPVPPGESKSQDTRYLDIREGALDEAQFTRWVKQASRLPGEKM